MMLFLSPDLVKGRAPEEYPRIPRPFVVKNKTRYWKGGVWGNPGKASAKKGGKTMKLITAKIIEVIDMIEKIK
jgi:creatinine amidohydrolase